MGPGLASVRYGENLEAELLGVAVRVVIMFEVRVSGSRVLKSVWLVVLAAMVMKFSESVFLFSLEGL